MIADDFQTKVAEVVRVAADLPKEEVLVFLDQACGDNKALRSAVENILNNTKNFINNKSKYEMEDDKDNRNDRPDTLKYSINSIKLISDPLIERKLGEFVIKEKLGQGGFGTVYKAKQGTLRREVVIKILHKNHLNDKKIVNLFKREARLAAKLEHPYAAHIYSFGTEADGLMWIAMEMIHGKPLSELIRSNGPLSLEIFVPLLEKICQVIHTAHELGIIHRDIKPANIMVISRSGQLLPKLLDFGIAKALDAMAIITKQTNSDKTVGTLGSPYYMAPEQWEDAGNVDARADIYSLGILAYEALIGKPPFEGNYFSLLYAHGFKSIPSLGNAFPKGLDDLIQKAVSKKPDDRFKTALEFADALSKSLIAAKPQQRSQNLEKSIYQDYIATLPQPIAQSIAKLVASSQLSDTFNNVIEIYQKIIRYIGIITLMACTKVGIGAEDDENAPTIFVDSINKLSTGGLSEVEWLELSRELCRQFIDNPEEYPIPELISFFFNKESKTVTKHVSTLVSLQKDLAAYNNSVNLDETILLTFLNNYLSNLSELLSVLSLLSKYKIVVLQENSYEQWMGITKSKFIANSNIQGIVKNKPVLINKDELIVLSLWPLVQIMPISPNNIDTLFLFDKVKNNKGVLMSTLPTIKEDPIVWEWFEKTFFEMPANGYTTKSIIQIIKINLSKVPRVLYFSLSIIFLIILISYDPLDPSLNVVTSRITPLNKFGVIGANIADLLFQIFGIFAFAIPILFIVSGLNLIKWSNFEFFRRNIFWLSLIFTSLTTLSFAIYTPFYKENIRMGGLLGYLIYHIFVNYLYAVCKNA